MDIQKEPCFILASGSPRRRDILHDLGFSFQVIPSLFNESAVSSDMPPEKYCALISESKGKEVAGRLKENPVLPEFILSSDTIVYSEKRGKIYGKPASPDDAFHILQELTGETHTVMSAVTLQHRFDAYPLRTRIQKSTVRFGSFPDDTLRRYAESGEPMDKAGAYGIQGRGLFLVERIEGCLSTIIGLPVSETLELLKQVINRSY